MQAYRMKHVPTGLYYCPSRKIHIDRQWAANVTLRNYVKSNLSKRGKVYLSQPTFKFIGRALYSHLASQGKDTLVPFIESEWAIEEVA